MINLPKANFRAQRGSAIIEALIALLVIGVGAVAVSILQSNALRASKSAVNRSTANLVASDLANRMLLNNTVINTFLTSTSAAVRVNSFGTEPSCGSYSSQCTSAADIKKLMLVRWGNQAESLLPGSKLTICRTSKVNEGTTSAPNCDGTGSVVIKLWYIDFSTDLKTVTTEPESMVAIPVAF